MLSGGEFFHEFEYEDWEEVRENQIIRYGGSTISEMEVAPPQAISGWDITMYLLGST